MSVPQTQTRIDVFDRIVCGVDDSAGSLAAVAQARTLVSPLGSLEFVAVVDPPAAVYSTYGAPAILDELTTDAGRQLDAAAEGVPRARKELLHGGVVARLLEEIEGTHATLVAVGARGHSRAVGAVLGRAASHLLHRARCSVLVARPAGDAFPTAIVAGTDGSPGAEAAVAVAQDLARRFDVPLRVIAATGGGQAVDLDSLAGIGSVEMDGRAPAAALVAASRAADLLVVGSRGVKGPAALGSVSERVGHHAACSVLVVRDSDG
jgi:nucleotide-binding universal stress UspA family protein